MASNKKNEVIELSLPANAAYVSAARLTASSIASRMVFDIDEIEDIKTAVSEACTFMIKRLPLNVNSEFKIVFDLLEDALKITIDTRAKIDITNNDEEFSLVMIKALMDTLDFSQKDINTFTMKMEKRHKAILFD